jgi:hypothetical protein
MRWSEHPLDAAVWFQRIEMIRDRGLPSTENALRHALHLLQLAPVEYRPQDGPAIDEESYEAFLSEGNYEQAARMLVSATTLGLTATTDDGSVRVAVRCSAIDHTVFGEGPTVADAILQVWSQYMLMLRSEKSERWLIAADRN